MLKIRLIVLSKTASLVVFMSIFSCSVGTFNAYSEEWRRINDEQGLLYIVNNKAHLGQSTRVDYGFQWQGEFCSNGTGIIYANGDGYPRTWIMTRDFSLCITSESGEKCYVFERSLKYRNKYRAGVEGMSPPFEFILTEDELKYCKHQ